MEGLCTFVLKGRFTQSKRPSPIRLALLSPIVPILGVRVFSKGVIGTMGQARTAKGFGLSGQQKRMVAVLLFGAVLVVMNQTLLSPALPAIMIDMAVDATTVQWLTSGYALVEAVVIPLNAYLMGRFRTRQLFIGSFILFAAGTLVAAMAPQFFVILIGRMLQACATGIVMPMVFTLILLIFPREKRGSAMGVVGLVIAFAPAVGPSLSGVLVDGVGWRALFLLVAIVSVIVIVSSAVLLKDQGPFEKATFDKLSVVVLAVGITCLLYGLSTFASSATIVVPIALMAIGAVFVVVFVRRQLALETPLLEVRVLKARRFRTITCIVPFLQAALVGAGVIFPIYIQSILGYSATVSGLMMLPGAVVGAACGLFAGKIFDRHGVRVVTLAGGALLAASGAGMVLFGMDSSIPFVVCINMSMAISLQLLTTPLNTWGVNSLENRVIQHGNALLNTLNQVGAAFGTALIMSLTALGSLYDPAAVGTAAQYAGVHIGFIGMCVMLCLVFAAIVLFVRNKKGEKVDSLAPSAAPHDGDLPLIVRTYMDREPVLVYDTATLREVLDKLAATSTSGLAVVDADKTVVGFVSDGDIMRYMGDSSGQVGDVTMFVHRIFDDDDLFDRALSLLTLNVMTIATKKVISVSSDMPINYACRIFAEQRLKKVPVIDDGKLVGTLSRRNIVQALNATLQAAVERVDREAFARGDDPEGAVRTGE